MQTTYFPPGAHPAHPRRLIGLDFQDPLLKTRAHASFFSRFGTLLLAIAIAFAPALTGMLFPPDAWYEGLVKAPWNPPNWLFGPAWTLLYLASGLAAWQMYEIAGRIRSDCFGGYALQWALNALWTPVFFGLHAPGLAMVVIVALLLSLVFTIEQFRRHSASAARLILPMLYWVAFAGSLNLYVLLAN